MAGPTVFSPCFRPRGHARAQGCCVGSLPKLAEFSRELWPSSADGGPEGAVYRAMRVRIMAVSRAGP